MPTLRELQSTFMNALLGSSPESALTMLRAPGEWASTQFEVYQNNVAINFLESLRSSYPVIARLVGEDYFRQLARGLRRRNPSRSGDLLWVGRHFEAYLGELHATGEYQYLPEVARLEWLCQESMLAAQHEPLDLAKLARTAEENPDALILVLHPTARYFESRFPALRIWESNVSSLDGEPDVIDLAAGGDSLLLLRRQRTLQFHRLDTAERRFVKGLLDSTPFSALVEECAGCDPGFDATTALQRWTSNGAIVDCRVPGSTTHPASRSSRHRPAIAGTSQARERPQ